MKIYFWLDLISSPTNLWKAGVTLRPLYQADLIIRLLCPRNKKMIAIELNFDKVSIWNCSQFGEKG